MPIHRSKLQRKFGGVGAATASFGGDSNTGIDSPRAYVGSGENCPFLSHSESRFGTQRSFDSPTGTSQRR
jgi:hypothetical protein